MYMIFIVIWIESTTRGGLSVSGLIWIQHAVQMGLIQIQCTSADTSMCGLLHPASCNDEAIYAFILRQWGPLCTLSCIAVTQGITAH